MPRRNAERNDCGYAEMERERRSEERDEDRRYASYDAASGVYQRQTRDQFHASLTADIERALGAAPKSLREIQAAEERAAAKAEYERLRAAPQHGLADFLGDLHPVPADKKAIQAAAKKSSKKSKVEKFSLDDI